MLPFLDTNIFIASISKCYPQKNIKFISTYYSTLVLLLHIEKSTKDEIKIISNAR